MYRYYKWGKKTNVLIGNTNISACNEWLGHKFELFKYIFRIKTNI